MSVDYECAVVLPKISDCDCSDVESQRVKHASGDLGHGNCLGCVEDTHQVYLT